MNQLLITESTAYPWVRRGGFAFRGYFVVDGELYRDEKAIGFLESQLQRTAFPELLQQLNGVFSIVVNNDNYVLLATDRVRGLPLFYSVTDGGLLISDDARRIAKRLPTLSVDHIAVEDFTKNNLFVTGPYTFLKEIKQVQAGEWVRFDNQTGEIHSDWYFVHAQGAVSSRSEQELLGEFESVFSAACDNLVTALDGRTAVVPLSGGIDSRFVLFMLRSAGYKKVLCFTYGRQGSEECAIASEVAKYFGYRWIWVPYSRKRWRQLRHDRLYDDYMAFAGNLASLPHVQDLLAVKLLRDQQLLSHDSVFVPGHTGTVYGGSLLPVFLDTAISYDYILQRIMKGTWRGKSMSSELTSRVASYFDPNFCLTNVGFAAQHHNFVMRERQAKYIINSIRVYEFFGYEWLLPLCDVCLLTFFSELPLSLKHNKKFIRAFVGLSIRSTRDDSFMKRLKALARAIPLTRVLGRKASIVTDYFWSSCQLEGLYGFWPFFKGLFCDNEFFDANTVTSHIYLDWVKDLLYLSRVNW